MGGRADAAGGGPAGAGAAGSGGSPGAGRVIAADEARTLMARYPEPRSALLPLLWLAQERQGYVSRDAMREIAELLGIGERDVLSVVTFYSMFRRQPPARRRLQLCRSLTCAFSGGEELLSALLVRFGERDRDGAYEIETVECLAACDRAPAALWCERLVGPLDMRRAEELLTGSPCGAEAGER
jgi:NADH-quinone oxidoreductase subunit E